MTTPYTRTHHHRLILKAQAGCRKSEARLVTENNGLVHRAMEYYQSRPDNRAAYDDLHQAGRIGLLQGIRRFDVNSKYKLSTYASFWIQKYVRAEYRASLAPIRIPRLVFEQSQHNKMSAYEAAYHQHVLTANIVPMELWKDNIPDPSDTDSGDEAEVLLGELFMKARLSSVEATCLTYTLGLFGHPLLGVTEAARTIGVSQKVVKESCASGRRKLSKISRVGGQLEFDTDKQ